MSTQPFEQGFLELVFRILTDSGLAIARIRSVSEGVLGKLRTSRRLWNADDLQVFDRIAHVLSIWHLHSDYVTPAATPRPLRMWGPGPTLSKLIKKVFPHAAPERVLATLKRVAAVRRRGAYWLPQGRRLVFQLPHVARMQILVDLLRLLHTAQYNLTHRQGKRLQRSAFNPSVPIEELARLQAGIEDRATHFLEEMDALLDRTSQRQVPASDPRSNTSHHAKRRRDVGAGVSVFFYREQGPTASTKERDLPKARRMRQR